LTISETTRTPSAPTSIIQIALRKRIWRVTLDGAFYGDYRSRRHAAESADAAAGTLRKAGSLVRLVSESGETFVC
jgi:hypothetical protein